jgi:hypothetical protein
MIEMTKSSIRIIKVYKAFFRVFRVVCGRFLFAWSRYYLSTDHTDHMEKTRKLNQFSVVPGSLYFILLKLVMRRSSQDPADYFSSKVCL